MEEKRTQFNIQLNEISDTDDPTVKEVEFILHDFRKNLNNSIISKETAEKAFNSLSNKPIVAKYYENSEEGADDDALGGHEPYLGKDRKDGDYILELRTTPIGVFTSPAYIKTVEEDGEEIEVVAGKGVLWNTRFSNAVGLIQEWYNNEIDVVSSMEILYDEYKVKDGVEEILNYVYEGHAVLNSEDRGDHDKVHPAYDVSKLTRMVAEAINQEKSKEGDNVSYNITFELSHDDIRSLIHEKVRGQYEAHYVWVVDVYNDYAIVNVFNEDEDKFIKLNYSQDDEEVSVDFESEVEVKEDRKWVETSQMQVMDGEIQAKEIEYKTLKAEKEDVDTKLKEANKQVSSLNDTIEGLSEYKEKYEKDQYEKSLNENKEYYSSKFEALGASDQYESEQVQELIEKSVNEESAVFELNSMLINLVEGKEKQEPKQQNYVQDSKKRENLIDDKSDFDSRYK